jgi:hypothetical protein
MSGLLQESLRQISRREQIACALGLWLGMVAAGEVLPAVQTPAETTGLTTESKAAEGDRPVSVFPTGAFHGLPAKDAGWIWIPFGSIQHRDVFIAPPAQEDVRDNTVAIRKTP